MGSLWRFLHCIITVILCRYSLRSFRTFCLPLGSFAVAYLPRPTCYQHYLSVKRVFRTRHCSLRFDSRLDFSLDNSYFEPCFECRYAYKDVCVHLRYRLISALLISADNAATNDWLAGLTTEIMYVVCPYRIAEGLLINNIAENNDRRMSRPLRLRNAYRVSCVNCKTVLHCPLSIIYCISWTMSITPATQVTRPYTKWILLAGVHEQNKIIVV